MNNAAFDSACVEQVQQPVRKSEEGAVAVIVAIVIVVLFSFAALAIDIGNAMIARNELQNVADAAALAGARTLGEAYTGLASGTSYASYWASNSAALTTTAQTAAMNVAITNQARQVAITLNAADITINFWDTTTRVLRAPNLAVGEGGTGVRVTARRDSSANGPVATWLASIMGIGSMSITATATAALTGTGSTGPGELETPFGISSFRFGTPYCDQPVRFFPTNDPISCAGWHTWFDKPNANRLRDNIDALQPDPPGSPETSVGDELEFTNGNIANALKNLYNLYDIKRYTDGDGNDAVWTALVPVYKGDDCSAPNTKLAIVGYATMEISNVQPPPNTQIIDGVVRCGYVDGGQGGGGAFGTLGSIPGLVE